MTASDDDIWEEVKKSVKPLQGRTRAKIAPAKPIRKKNAERIMPVEKPLVKVTLQPLPAQRVRQLKQKKIPIEATLDLHGMTLEKGHAALKRFLSRARTNHLRCVEIITGRGDPAKGTGKMKRHLPLWLEDEAMILHVEENPQSRGGSYLIMLRRVRS